MTIILLILFAIVYSSWSRKQQKTFVRQTVIGTICILVVTFLLVVAFLYWGEVNSPFYNQPSPF